jgi:transcriptional adapter 2-alpha
LCSVSRLVPESYMEFRNILIAECRNRKGIRLAQARTLIKIDVNKTRKIFDFLLEEKLIYFPA